MAVNASMGAGSGGSITVTADSVLGGGVISVVGGNTFGPGGAGGGGRVTFAGMGASLAWTAFSILIHGGHVIPNTNLPNDLYLSNVCLNGGAGTFTSQIYLVNAPTAAPYQEYYYTSPTMAPVNQNRSSGNATYYAPNGRVVPFIYSAPVSNSAIYIDNNNIDTLGATFVDSIPAETTLLVGINGSQLLLSNDLKLLANPSCIGPVLSEEDCSTLSLINATMTVYNASLVEMKAQVVIIKDEGSLSGVPPLLATSTGRASYFVNVTCDAFTTDFVSPIYFSHILSIHSASNVDIRGLVTSTTATSPSIDTNQLRIYAVANITVHTITVDNVLLYGENVDLIPSSVIAHSSANVERGACWMDISYQDFTCDGSNAYNGTIAGNRTVIVSARNTVNIGSFSTINAAAIQVCANFVTVRNNATLSATALGCGPGHGKGAGQYVQNTGGGGGFGGSGGPGESDANSGGRIYFDGGPTLSSGSGGGCSGGETNKACSVAGGIISIIARAQLTLQGQVKADGANGCLLSSGGACGGGSGGSVVINTVFLAGHALISSKGGNASHSTSGASAGGGGGGVISIYDATSPVITTPFAFSGALKYLGGLPNGGTGQVILPYCEAGYGNNLATGAICQECALGKYNTGINRYDERMH